MTHKSKTFTVADPRTFDGNPFEVADRAVAQAENLARLLAHTLEGANLMARNAEMERNLQAGDEPGAQGWEGSAQGKRFGELIEAARAAERRLQALRTAAGYDPRNPPKAED